MLIALTLVSIGCKGDTDTATPPGKTWACVVTDEDPAFSQQIGCLDDFEALAADPLNASIPGARSVKTVLDRIDGDALYFQNSETYQIHWEFCFEHLSGDGLPLVPDLGGFNTAEYYSPDRRFVLGAVTFYEEPAVWVYEISPYDTADADMIATAFRNIRDNSFFGDELYFHPTSISVEAVAEELPDDVPVITTDELFAGITYQPLNLATSMGQLSFYAASTLDDQYVNYREIVVLDSVPNDISVTAGIITAEFQTPLSHINVLSQNRGTPNMGLENAFEHPDLSALEGKWVELTVGAQDWSIREVTPEEAEKWWENNKPDPLETSPMDVSVTELTDCEDILQLDELDLGDAISTAVPAFGGKASHYGGLALIEGVQSPDAFAVPVHYYDQHMQQNGLWDLVEANNEDEEFHNNLVYRAIKLAELQDAIRAAPLDPDFEALLTTKLEAEYPNTPMRFRSSTNAEDLSGFNGAGLYTSQTGEVGSDDDPIADAVREVWSSIWSVRAYEERAYYSIDHRNIGMALLVHPSFPDEEANGVAITANIYDTSGLEPAFYVNVQEGEASVVQPSPGFTTDQFLYYYDLPGQPIVFIGHSNIVPDGETVLTNSETYDLGGALKAIHQYFFEVYGGDGFYGMDVEFKFDDRGSGEPELWVKQARPYPGWD